jgi:hypothetical protein
LRCGLAPNSCALLTTSIGLCELTTSRDVPWVVEEACKHHLVLSCAALHRRKTRPTDCGGYRITEYTRKRPAAVVFCAACCLKCNRRPTVLTGCSRSTVFCSSCRPCTDCSAQSGVRPELGPRPAPLIAELPGGSNRAHWGWCWRGGRRGQAVLAVWIAVRCPHILHPCRGPTATITAAAAAAARVDSLTYP